MIAYEVAVWCDAGGGCEASIVWDIVHNPKGAGVDARAHAKDLGWTRKRRATGIIRGMSELVDLCPEHSGVAAPEGDDRG